MPPTLCLPLILPMGCLLQPFILYKYLATLWTLHLPVRKPWRDSFSTIWSSANNMQQCRGLIIWGKSSPNTQWLLVWQIYEEIINKLVKSFYVLQWKSKQDNRVKYVTSRNTSAVKYFSQVNWRNYYLNSLSVLLQGILKVYPSNNIKLLENPTLGLLLEMKINKLGVRNIKITSKW